MDIPPGQHLKPPFRPRLAVLARRLADRAERFEASARRGTPALSFRSAWAVLAAARIYGAIGREVAARGEHAWDHRVATSKAAKLSIIMHAAREAMQRKSLYPPAPRDQDLWQRPR
jgi:phytoene synthase